MKKRGRLFKRVCSISLGTVERELQQLPKLAWLEKQSWFKCVRLPLTASVKPHPTEPKRERLKKDGQEWLKGMVGME